MKIFFLTLLCTLYPFQAFTQDIILEKSDTFNKVSLIDFSGLDQIKFKEIGPKILSLSTSGLNNKKKKEILDQLSKRGIIAGLDYKIQTPLILPDSLKENVRSANLLSSSLIILVSLSNNFFVSPAFFVRNSHLLLSII